MARVSGTSTLAWFRRLRRLLSDAHRAPTRSSVSGMLLLRLVAMGCAGKDWILEEGGVDLALLQLGTHHPWSFLLFVFRTVNHDHTKPKVYDE
ncbi:hypothetical protein ACQJBY_016073 [Aegilops geniculata]